MNVGKLDRPIQLESFAETKSATSGGITTAYTPLGTEWAQVTYKNGQERQEGEQVQAVQTVIFRIRFRPDGLSTRYRVTYAGKQFDILAVAEVGRGEGLDLTAENQT